MIIVKRVGRICKWMTEGPSMRYFYPGWSVWLCHVAAHGCWVSDRSRRAAQTAEPSLESECPPPPHPSPQPTASHSTAEEMPNILRERGILNHIPNPYSRHQHTRRYGQPGTGHQSRIFRLIGTFRSSFCSSERVVLAPPPPFPPASPVTAIGCTCNINLCFLAFCLWNKSTAWPSDPEYFPTFCLLSPLFPLYFVVPFFVNALAARWAKPHTRHHRFI